MAEEHSTKGYESDENNEFKSLLPDEIESIREKYANKKHRKDKLLGLYFAVIVAIIILAFVLYYYNVYKKKKEKVEEDDVIDE